MSLSQAFGYKAVGAGSGLSPAFSASAASAPRTTLLGALSPQTSFKVAVDTSQGVKAQPGAAGLVQPLRAGLTATQKNVSQARAGITGVIQQAQGQIIAACKAAELEVGDVFPNTQIAPNSSAELLLDAVPLPGGLAALNVAEKVQTIMADRTKPAAEAQMEIERILREASTARTPGQSFGLIRDANEAPVMEAASIDWSMVLDQYPDALKEIMALDPENPSTLPEYIALNDADNAIEAKLGELKTVEAEVPKLEAADVEIWSEALSGLRISNVKPETLSPLNKTPKTYQPGLNREFKAAPSVDMAYRA